VNHHFAIVVLLKLSIVKYRFAIEHQPKNTIVNIPYTRPRVLFC